MLFSFVLSRLFFFFLVFVLGLVVVVGAVIFGVDIRCTTALVFVVIGYCFSCQCNLYLSCYERNT